VHASWSLQGDRFVYEQGGQVNTIWQWDVATDDANERSLTTALTPVAIPSASGH